MSAIHAWYALNATGRGITVAIVGDGVHSDHPELASAFVPTSSFDFITNSAKSDPDNSNAWGTMFAGIIAGAPGNGVCSVGIAPEARIAAIRVADATSVSNDATRAAAFLHGLDTNDIYYGAGLYREGWDSTLLNRVMVSPGPLEAAAFERMQRAGRQGKGAVTIFEIGPVTDCSSFMLGIIS